MKSDPLHCTHCNAMVRTAEPFDPPKRLRCCQCEEVFVHPPGATITDGDVGPLETLPTMETASPSKSNSRVALIVLGVMFLVGGLTLLFALRTADFREKVTLKKKGELTDFLPAKLPALGYVPADSDIVAGIHVGNLLHTAPGKQWIDEKSNGLGWLLQQFENATGIAPGGIDHLVAAAKASDLSHWALIARTRIPYDPKAVAQESREETTQFRGKTAYRVRMKPAGSGWLWCADKQTLVLLWQIGFGELGDLSRFPGEPRDGLDGLTPALQQLLKQRVDKRGRCWLAGVLKGKLHKIAMSAIFTDTMTLVGSAQGKTITDTREISRLLEKRGGGLKVFPPPQKIDNSDQNWVNWQYRGDPLRGWASVKALLEAQALRRKRH